MTTQWPGDDSAKLKTHPVSGTQVLCHEAWTGAALSTAWVERIEKVSCVRVTDTNESRLGALEGECRVGTSQRAGEMVGFFFDYYWGT